MVYDPLNDIFGNGSGDVEEKDKLKNPSNSSQSRTATADPLNDIFGGGTAQKTVKQVQVETEAKPQEPSGFFDKALNIAGKVAKGVGNVFNKIQRKNDEAALPLQELMYGKSELKKDPVTGKNILTTPRLEAWKGAKTEEEKAKILEEAQADIPLIKFLNTPTGEKITGGVSRATSNVPLKVIAGIKAIGDDTYDEAKAALLAKAKDPNNSRFEKIMYGLQDSGVQSAIGALLAVGTSMLTKNPKAGQAVSLAYFAPISAESQRQEKGKVTSVGNIVIDTVGDTVLSGVAEAALKSTLKEGAEVTLKTFLKESAKGFVAEGGTEVSQTFLKHANDYKNAKTEEEKKKVVAALAEYVKNGGMVDEFLIGGLSGSAITGVATLGGKVMGNGSAGNEINPSLQQGDEGAEGGGGGGKRPEFNTDFAAAREEASTLEKEARSDPSNDDIAQRLAIVQDQLFDYQQAVKERPIYISDETQENPLATVETVQYPDGKFAYSFSADTQSNSIVSPFLNTETYATKEEAIAAGKKAVLDWVKSQLPNATGAELAKLKEIQQEIGEVKVKKEKGVKEPAIKPQKEDKKPLSKQIEQVNPNVTKTGTGTYRVTQYSKKGESEGRVEARFTKSTRTGKLYFEVQKDGKRTQRMSLEEAKRKFKTTDRALMVERAVNGTYNKESGKFDMRQSNAPVIKNTSQQQVENKPVKVKGQVKNSRAFERVAKRLGEYADVDVNYNKLNLAKDTAKALEFVEKNPKEAKKIALGLMGAPEGITETAISIALAEQAAENKDYALQAQLERSRSLRQTRRGQEIVAERGRFNEDSPHFFMQQILAARLENAGKQTFKFLKRKKETRAQNAQAKIQEGTQGVKDTVKKRLTATDLAQNVIDQLTC